MLPLRTSNVCYALHTCVSLAFAIYFFNLIFLFFLCSVFFMVVQYIYCEKCVTKCSGQFSCSFSGFFFPLFCNFFTVLSELWHGHPYSSYSCFEKSIYEVFIDKGRNMVCGIKIHIYHPTIRRYISHW